RIEGVATVTPPTAPGINAISDERTSRPRFAFADRTRVASPRHPWRSQSGARDGRSEPVRGSNNRFYGYQRRCGRTQLGRVGPIPADQEGNARSVEAREHLHA